MLQLTIWACGGSVISFWQFPNQSFYIVETLTARQSHNIDVSYIHFELCVVQTLQLRCTDMEACSTKVG